MPEVEDQNLAIFLKVIRGFLIDKLGIPFFNVDRDPADEPFEIVV